MHPLRLPDQFVRTVEQTFAPQGREWLQNLPNLLAWCGHHWQLTILPPYPNLSYNYVAPARRRDGTAVVLKLGIPRSELVTEAAALTHFNGRGAVRLLAANLEKGALLLNQLTPGHTLASQLLSNQIDDDTATRLAAQLMAALWQPPPDQHPFPTTADWAKGFQRLRRHFAGGTGPLPEKWVAKAEAIFAELLADSSTTVLLHGDLHHENILASSGNTWTAVDPKGVIGEPAYEAGTLLRNPYPAVTTWPELSRRQARRLDILAETIALDRQKMARWAFAQAVLSAWWSIEDGGTVEKQWLIIAQSLNS
ncbi:MAG: streptomycin 6-kinase [Candidatus Promineifilaceae bacterium]